MVHKGSVTDLSAGSSKILWELELSWNGGQKTEVDSFYWADSPDAVTKEAVALWPLLGNPEWRDNETNVDGSETKPGQPYYGFACLNAGSSSCGMFVSAVKHHKRYGGNGNPEMDKFYPSPGTTGGYGINTLKRILRSRSIPFAAGEKKDDLAIKLHDYLEEWIPTSREVAVCGAFAPPTSWPGEEDIRGGASAANEAASEAAETTGEPVAKKAKVEPASLLRCVIPGEAPLGLG